jgi:crotonobetainyl-CoA:carnitine CoA-transferase CaiB-like acyl-CoA transferase
MGIAVELRRPALRDGTRRRRSGVPSHLEERRLKIEMDIPALPDRSDVAIVNAGFIMSEDGPDVSDPPPLHGQHTEEVLSSLGFSEEQRRAIRTSPRSSS